MSRDRRGWLAGAVSVAAHLLVGLALLPVLADPPVAPYPEPPPPVVVTLVDPPPPPPPPPQPAPAGPAEPAAAPAAAQPSPPPKAPVRPRPTPPPLRPRPARPSPTVPPVPIAPTPAPPEPAPPATLSDAQLAGAMTVGAGRGGGPGSGAGGGGGGPGGSGGDPCDMIRRLQEALRADPDIQAAVRQAQATPGTGGRALLIWNGDWIQNPGQAGRGLAGVRQAIAVEVAFAPRECRTQRVSGYAVIAMSDAPGAARVALGSGSWRWGDLTGSR